MFNNSPQAGVLLLCAMVAILILVKRRNKNSNNGKAVELASVQLDSDITDVTLVEK
jgi:hypothetical protein